MEKFGIGFRSETLADLQRILDFGIQPLYKSVGIAEGLGHKIKGTIMDTAVRQGEMALWKKNQDAVGNTAICISRNLLGATKFPEPQYSGVICTFAVRPSKPGFDTETWQKTLGNKAVWRPGEKLFPGIDKADIIAYTKVEKSAGSLDDDARMWGFKFLEDNWTFLGGNYAEKEYLNGELKSMRALTDTTWVPKSDDFYKN